MGHWDGDAFVIDSIGFKDTQVWADENGSPHSDALHVIERWTRPDAKHIHVDTTIEDPKFYTKTFTYSRTWEAGEPGQRLEEYSCAENPVDREHLGFGPGRFVPMESADTSIQCRCRRRRLLLRRSNPEVAGDVSGRYRRTSSHPP